MDRRPWASSTGEAARANSTSMRAHGPSSNGRILILGEWPDGRLNSGGGPRRFNKRLCESLEASGVALDNPRRQSQGSSKFAQVRALLKSVIFARPTVVHVTTDGFHVFAALFCKLLHGSRIVYSVHSLVRVWPEITECIPRIDKLRRWIMEKSMTSFADCAVFPSGQYLAASVPAGYQFQRRETVHHGCDSIASTSARNLPAEPLRFSVFGPALKVKGIERVPQLLAELDGLGPLYWIGYDASDPHQLTSHFLSLGTSPAISFRPAVPPDEIGSEFNRSAISIMPSLRESFGIVALESAAAGVPVVVSTTTGVAELVTATNCGAVVNFDRPGELREAVQAILGSYESFSTAAISCARQYPWSLAASKYRDVYQSLGANLPAKGDGAGVH